MARMDLPRGHGLSMAGEDYLEAIYRIMVEGGDRGIEGGVRSVDVAEQLEVSKASVSKALSTLKEAGMVEQVRYGRVMLTEKGKVYAKRVWRSHRVPPTRRHASWSITSLRTPWIAGAPTWNVRAWPSTKLALEVVVHPPVAWLAAPLADAAV